MSFVRATSNLSRAGVRFPIYRATPIAWRAQRGFSQTFARKNDAHSEESFEEFTARYGALMAGLGGTGQLRRIRELRIGNEVP